MFMLRCLAGCIIWLSVLGIIAFFALAGVFFLVNAEVIPGSFAGY
jgi:hypothetical protein